MASVTYSAEELARIRHMVAEYERDWASGVMALVGACEAMIRGRERWFEAKRASKAFPDSVPLQSAWLDANEQWGEAEDAARAAIAKIRARSTPAQQKEDEK